MSRGDATVDELTARAQTRVGQQVRGKWQIDALLGVGGMAAVYAATHRNGKRVAMKVLHKEVMNDDSRTRFAREGYVANAIGHKGAVGVIDDDLTEDGAPYFTMDLLEGETLDQRVRRKGKLAVEEVLAATYQLLDVLAAAHDKGIVHRDIKPENVFLTRDALIKVLDFGIAHLAEFNGSLTAATQSGHTMGTPSFMAPEQARGRWDQVDARSDVWAVGALMFACLTGRHVHEADTMNEVLLEAMTKAAKPIASARPSLPGPVSAVVDRALSFAKGDRWQSAKEMQSAVREAYRSMKQSIEELGREPTLVAAPSSGPKLPPPPLSERNRPEVTTAGPTTRSAPLDPQAFAVRRTRMGVALGSGVGVLLAVLLMKVAIPGARAADPLLAATPAQGTSSVTVALESHESTPATESSGAPVMTVLPPATSAPAAVVKPVPVPPPPATPRWRPRHANPPAAPAPATLAPESASPAPLLADPLTRRH